MDSPHPRPPLKKDGAKQVHICSLRMPRFCASHAAARLDKRTIRVRKRSSICTRNTGGGRQIWQGGWQTGWKKVFFDSGKRIRLLWRRLNWGKSGVKNFSTVMRNCDQWPFERLAYHTLKETQTFSALQHVFLHYCCINQCTKWKKNNNWLISKRAGYSLFMHWSEPFRFGSTFSVTSRGTVKGGGGRKDPEGPWV